MKRKRNTAEYGKRNNCSEINFSTQLPRKEKIIDFANLLYV